jgi:hypothetical protein
MGQTYKLRSKVIRYPGMDAWHFVAVPLAAAKKIKASQTNKPRKGWGSVRVMVTMGKSKWQTSIFPDKSGVYLLPLKAQVRAAEGVGHGDMVSYILTIR